MFILYLLRTLIKLMKPFVERFSWLGGCLGYSWNWILPALFGIFRTMVFGLVILFGATTLTSFPKQKKKGFKTKGKQNSVINSTLFTLKSFIDGATQGVLSICFELTLKYSAQIKLFSRLLGTTDCFDKTVSSAIYKTL